MSGRSGESDSDEVEGSDSDEVEGSDSDEVVTSASGGVEGSAAGDSGDSASNDPRESAFDGFDAAADAAGPYPPFVFGWSLSLTIDSIYQASTGILRKPGLARR